MKKKHLLICICVIIILISFILIIRNREEIPFKDLSAEEISEVSVQLLPPDVTLRLNESEINDLVKILHSVVIYNRDDSYKNYNGQAVSYIISKTDGTTMRITAYNPFLIIEGTGYKTKYEPCEQLNRLGNQIREADHS
jgi:hypothetical protein